MMTLAESRTSRQTFTPIRIMAQLARHIADYIRDRRILRELEVMDDHILADIGFSRTDIERAKEADAGTDVMAMLHRARTRRSA